MLDARLKSGQGSNETGRGIRVEDTQRFTAPTQQVKDVALPLSGKEEKPT